MNIPAGASLATTTAGGAFTFLRSRIVRTRRPRYGYIIARNLIGNIWLYWEGPNRQYAERWTYRQGEAYRHRFSDSAEAAILGNNLPKDSLILRVKF